MSHVFTRSRCPDAPPGEPPQLSRRQEEILALITDGLQNKQIAHRLGISEATVKAHVSKTIHQTGCNNRVGLALLWLRRTGRLAS